MKIYFFIPLFNCLKSPKTKLTYYWVVEEPKNTVKETKILDKNDKLIKYTSKTFYDKLHLEGSGYLNDKR